MLITETENAEDLTIFAAIVRYEMKLKSGEISALFSCLRATRRAVVKNWPGVDSRQIPNSRSFPKIPK